jgi:hypothetical protein
VQRDVLEDEGGFGVLHKLSCSILGMHGGIQKFRKEYIEGFARIINCTKDFESVCNNHQSYCGFMKENIQGIKWITNLFFLQVSQTI